MFGDAVDLVELVVPEVGGPGGPAGGLLDWLQRSQRPWPLEASVGPSAAARVTWSWCLIGALQPVVRHRPPSRRVRNSARRPSKRRLVDSIATSARSSGMAKRRRRAAFAAALARRTRSGQSAAGRNPAPRIKPGSVPSPSSDSTPMTRFTFTAGASVAGFIPVTRAARVSARTCPDFELVEMLGRKTGRDQARVEVIGLPASAGLLRLPLPPPFPPYRTCVPTVTGTTDSAPPRAPPDRWCRCSPPSSPQARCTLDEHSQNVVA